MNWTAWIEDHLVRGLRLAIFVCVVAFLFPAGRLYALIVLALLLLIYGAVTWKLGGWRYVATLIVLGGIGFLTLLVANHQRARVVDFLAEQRPIDLALVPDGSYEGTGPGNNGEIKVLLQVADGSIKQVKVLEHRDAVYAFDDVLPRLVGRSHLSLADMAGFVFRNERSLVALQAAMEDAVLPAIFDAPTLSSFARTVFFFTSNEGSKITVNALAIIFIVLLAFDFSFGPTLRPGLGQSLNCYNCQACVGVCPVKMVEGDPFPMIMVLEARLGDVDRVAELAKYCVGCGKCAAKCPVGNSGASIGSAAYQIVRDRERRKKRRDLKTKIDVRGNGHV